MISLSSSRENLNNHFYYRVKLYDRQRFPTLKAIYQFILQEGKETYFYYILIADGKAEFFEGQHPAPSIKIYSPVYIWFDIAIGKLNGLWGFLTRKYRIEGPVYYLIRMKEIFGKRLDKTNIPEIGEDITDFEIPKKRVWKKPNRVLVFNGSPREKKGFTYFYLQYLLKGIQEAGVEVELINIYDKSINIESCRGCFNCWYSKSVKCVIQDDASKLFEKIENAYLTIYAFPLCGSTAPDKLVAFMQRQFVFCSSYFTTYQRIARHPRKNKKERYSALFSIGGTPNLREFDLVTEIFKNMGTGLHSPVIASIFRPAAPALFKNSNCRKYLMEVLDLLPGAGKELILTGKVSKSLLKAISKNYISLGGWLKGINLYSYLEQEEGSGNYVL